ncbi:amino acid ABC transporter permease [Aeromicrobium tamlense]|uniref:Amino acid ABC transporter permease n=1 Tax=Aeromicrobium tamlense TaxID=375541 RepID=A0A8I0FVZ2_9ACTN|nr:amino acid ABC transporter permease [Aeromicrobium tamlense]MBD1270763.1 amino acid ABC transporter permease [Aeromicrobium tamlense]MBD1271105.1 amino acid ABC transporter permease [Aeromicrobium tamlense]NYI38155.1 polar amino acid transport system permease protein [Aeromicrobium tamlense]
MIEDWIAWFPELLDGLQISLTVALASIVLGLVLGTLVALASVSGHRPVRWLSVALVEVLRGVPALVLIYLVYFGLPGVGLTLEAWTAAVLAIGVNTAAYMGEIIRAGLLHLPPGQSEAAQSLGLTRLQELRAVVLPQALRTVFPSLVSYSVIVFQATSLCYLIGVRELLSVGFSIGSVTFEYLSVLTLVGLIYVVVSIAGSRLAHAVEARSKQKTSIPRS